MAWKWNHIFSRAATDRPLEEGIHSIVQEAAKLLHATSACISIADDTRDFVKVVHCNETFDANESIYYPRANSLLVRLEESQQCALVWRPGTQASCCEAETLGSREILSITLQVGRRLIGCLSFSTCSTAASADDELAFLGVVVGSMLSEHLRCVQCQRDAIYDEHHASLATCIREMNGQDNLCDLFRVATCFLQRDIGMQGVVGLLKHDSRLRCLGTIEEGSQSSVTIPAAWRMDDPKFEPAQLTDLAGQAYLMLPIAMGDDLLGAIYARGCIQDCRATKKHSLEILLFSLASCVRKHQSQAEAVAMRRDVAAANAAKTRFLSNISHEIRTPLNSIMGLSSLLQDSATDTGTQESLETIVRSADILNEVIHDLLDLSRMESGHVKLLPSPCVIRSIAEQCIEITRGSLGEKQLNIELDWQEPVPHKLVCDETRLTQILLNLLANAVKFTQEGRIVLSVSYDISTSTASFVVSDTGIGIPAHSIEQIFAPFYQGNPISSVGQGGPGLGLTISRQLCEMMDGELSVESREGRGSKFTVELPLKVSVKRTAKLGSGSPTAASDTRLLFVDDNELNRSTAKALLSKLVTDVTIVSSGFEAIAEVQRKAPDIIMMDINMPEMDGIETSRRIRELDLGKRPYIIAVSGHVQEEFRIQATEADMDEFLEKPYTIRQLGEILEGAINRPRILDSGLACLPGIVEIAKISHQVSEERTSLIGPRR